MPDDVNQVLDRLEANDPAGGAATEPEPQAATPPAAEGGAAAPAAPAPGESAESWLDTLPPDAAKEIRDLRGENQRYRTRFNEAFDGFNEEDRDFLVGVLRNTRSDDPNVRAQAAQAWRQVADILSPAEQAAMADAVGAAPQQEFLTKADLDAALAARDRETHIEKIYADVEALGFERGSFEATRAMQLAVNQTSGDLAAAAELVKAEKQSWIDQYLAAKSSDADATTTPAPPTGAAPSSERDVASMNDSERRAAVREFLAARQG